MSDERGALGLRRIKLDWQLSEIDKRSIRELAILVGREFGRLEKGRVGMPQWLLDHAQSDNDPLVPHAWPMIRHMVWSMPTAEFFLRVNSSSPEAVFSPQAVPPIRP